MAGRELAAVFRLKDEASEEFERMHGHIEKLEGKLNEVPNAAHAAMIGLAGVASAAIALGAAAFELGEAFDDALDTITIKSGAMGDTLDQLNEDFKNVVSSVPSSFQDAADAIALLHARTGETGEALQALAEQVLNLSRLTKTDVGENVREVTRFFGDWSVATEDQGEALDKLFRAAQMSGQSVSSLAGNVVQFGAPMRQLGIDMDTAISLFAKWEKEGVNVETVAATMRQALAKMAEAGLDPKETFDKLINTIHDMEDPIEATTLAMSVFGKRGGADMAAAIREGRFAVDDYKAALDDAGGAINEAADKTDDAKQRMQTAWNELKVAAKPIVDDVFEALNKALEAAIPLIKTFAENMKNIAEAFKAMKEGKITWQEVAAAAMGVNTRPEVPGGRTQMPTYVPPRPEGLPTVPTEEPPPEPPPAGGGTGTSGAGLTAEEIAALKKDPEAEKEAAREAKAAAAETKREQAAAVREAERILKEQERQAAREAEVEAQRANTIRELGQKRADAINAATDAAAEAIAKAQKKEQEQIDKAQEDFDRERENAQKREDLQKEIAAKQRELQANQQLTQLGRAETREDADRTTARLREQADIETRRTRELAQISRQQMLQDADIARQQARATEDAATSRSRSLRDAQIQANRSLEDMEREHQERLAEIAKQGGPNQAQAIAAENESYSKQQVNFERQQQRAAEDRARAAADQQADQEKARARAAQDLSLTRARMAEELKLRRQFEDDDYKLRQDREDADRALRRDRAREDIKQGLEDAKTMQAAMEALNQPLKDFNQKILEDNLAEKIAGYVKAKEDAVNAANATLEQRTAQAEEQYQQGVERANNIGVPQTVILNNYNNGLQGPETIEDMVDNLMDQAAQRLALTGA